MKYDDLPERWEKKIKEYLRSHSVSDRDKLSAYNFSGNLIAKIRFNDGSTAKFHYSLVIEAPDLDEVGVFTEHCGYHIFNLKGTHIIMEQEV